MGLAFTVETFDTSSRRHTVGHFRSRSAACSCARLTLVSPRVTLAVVKDNDGAMVYAIDRDQEWDGEGVSA